MQAFYTDHFELPLPEGHRFPMSKYRLLRERIASRNEDGSIRLQVPDPADPDALRLAHDADYVASVFDGTLGAVEQRRIGFPWSPGMVERSRRSVGATIAAARCALEEGASVNLAGGTHHAGPARGQGYCVFNDVAVAAHLLLAEGQIGRAAVVDCDVHQGNGTAEIFAEDERVFTFSIHGAKNFPARKHPGDLDVVLPTGTGDGEYLDALDSALLQVFEAGPFDLVFYVSGADPFEADTLGHLSLSKAGLAQRDERVFGMCLAHDVPVAVGMAGGYAPDVADIVDIHEETVRQAARATVRNRSGVPGRGD
ncbi:Acetoin utilization protein AcuC [Maioricimonas rarisocia]|uniref:Acetoin utilization protein AcuC n=1 Tax=Maioricimonas rarisocia TaxID=2528026 RepID=A0A517Z913_9PLAN|nr:histone deacetylase [Maioricimonas rarisocia]QDU38965.1 Acetoin utilization protein AcuC [Maioricimonas rarisocia]